MSELHQPAEGLDFLPPHDPILSQTAESVAPFQISKPEIQEIIDRMFATAYGEQGDAKRPTMVGLAAPQVGISQRIIIVGINSTGLGEQPELQAFINPKIIGASDETELGREGCYSTSRVCGIVDRAKSITYKAYDRTGEIIQGKLEGFPARVFQHEVDHLDGIRFPDRVSDDQNLHWVELDEFGDYRVKWQDWQKRCSRDRWEAIKAGAAQ